MKELKKYAPAPKPDFSKMSPLEKFRFNLNNFGFMIPNGVEFYEVLQSKRIGMKVGGFTHSCHVESSDVVILFHIEDNGKHFINEYWGCWDLEKI